MHKVHLQLLDTIFDIAIDIMSKVGYFKGKAELIFPQFRIISCLDVAVC